jgi:hypothetical protein
MKHEQNSQKGSTQLLLKMMELKMTTLDPTGTKATSLGIIQMLMICHQLRLLEHSICAKAIRSHESLEHVVLLVD